MSDGVVYIPKDTPSHTCDLPGSEDYPKGTIWYCKACFQYWQFDRDGYSSIIRWNRIKTWKAVEKIKDAKKQEKENRAILKRAAKLQRKSGSSGVVVSE